MSVLYLYDDARARRFEPFALTRPVGSLTAGMAPIWRRWQTALQCEVAGFVGTRHLDGFDDGFTTGMGTTPRMATDVIPAGSIMASARFAPAVEILALRGLEASIEAGNASHPLTPDPRVGAWRSGGVLTAVRLAREVRVDELREDPRSIDAFEVAGTTEEDVRGWWIDDVWDLVRLLPTVLTDDLVQAATGLTPVGRKQIPFAGPPPAHATVLGTHPVLVGIAAVPASHAAGQLVPATVEPHVVLDATHGPIVIAHGAHVRAFTRLTGPCYVGLGSTVMGGDIDTCSIGPVCKVRGEMSHSIMLGYANKGHDGFVGHSLLGRWTNLGAGTITSNLKNTYGSVSLWTPDGIRETGMQFLGTLFGDHAKSGIGTRLTTGTVLGAGANVYGSAMPPKAVPPFAWGERPPYQVFRLDKFLEVAERAMARRKVALSEGARRQLAAAHAARWSMEGEGTP